MRVSNQEIEEHERTHTPFRSLCKYCVRVRANNAQLRRMKTTEEEEWSKVSMVSIDYFFMSQADEETNIIPYSLQ